MDDRFDNRPESAEGLTTPHLTLEQLTSYLDGEVTTGERVRLDDHLRSCLACRRELAELRSTVVLLNGLPEYRPRRSFQLTPDRVAAARPWWERLGVRLLPALPALRAATVAAAILLVAVSAGDVIRDRSGNSPSPHDTALVQPTTVPTTQGFVAAAPTSNSGSSAPTAAAGPPEEQQAAKEPTEQAQTGTVRKAQATTTAEADTGGASDGFAAGTTSETGENEAPVESAGSGDTSGRQETSDDGAQTDAAAPAAAGAAPAETPEGSDGDTESIAMAAVSEEATAEPATTSGGEGGGGAGSDTTADEGAASEAAPLPSPSPTPSATPSPTTVPATPTAVPPTASPTTVPATPTAVPATPVTNGQPAARNGDDGVSEWRIVEIGLAVLLVWLAVTVIGLQRLRGRR